MLSVLVITAATLAFAGGNPEAAGATASPAQPAATSGLDTDGDGIPDSAEPTLHTDADNPDTDGDGLNDLADPQPLYAENQIVNDRTAQGFTIDKVQVENNVDSHGKDTSDHLEMLVTNTTDSALTGFEVYYSITDLVTDEVEAYYAELPGFSLAAGQSKPLHFDNSGADGHFRVNPHSLYATSKNEMMFDIVLHAAGFAVESAQVKKDAGGEELAD